MDRINPNYYKEHPSGVECIDITRHYCFDIGCAIKYLWRAGLKQEDGLTNTEKETEDLKKAIWYIQDRIDQLEKITPSNILKHVSKLTGKSVSGEEGDMIDRNLYLLCDKDYYDKENKRVEDVKYWNKVSRMQKNKYEKETEEDNR